MKKYLMALLLVLQVLFLGGCSSASEKNSMQQSNVNDEKINAVEEETNENAINEEKIYDYLKAESKEVLSTYYELLDFKIKDYEETSVDNTTESVFIYTISYKNFDKDPDTVEYIKQAKENKDPYYQTYYDEYLEPKELNMELKAVIDKDGAISLYTDNNPHDEREWVLFKMSDIVL